MNSTQEKLTKIEAVIREVCPELQELTFGCVIKLDSGFTRQVWQVEYDEDDNVDRIFTESGSIGMYQYTNPNSFDIIGHPIHLEHILRAIYELGDTIYMSTTGEVIDAGTCMCNYDFTLPLHLQSDEFISWLYGVLCE